MFTECDFGKLLDLSEDNIYWWGKVVTMNIMFFRDVIQGIPVDL